MTKERKYHDRAERLKKIRGNIPVEDFASELGINLATYYRYERGETPVSDGHLKLAEIIRSQRDAGLGKLADPSPAYDLHGGYTPDAEAALGVERGSEQWRAFAMLSQIYASEDQALIRAIYSNLCAFAESAERKRENAELKRDVEALQARLNEVVVQLDQKGIVCLNDRRSGVERRVDLDPHAPDGHDRRSGHDRRKAAPG
jgi:transcriptional regulator with XRE-family HTH domain